MLGLLTLTGFSPSHTVQWAIMDKTYLKTFGKPLLSHCKPECKSKKINFL